MAIPKINNAVTTEMKFLSTRPAGDAPAKLKIYETEKVVKYVHVAQPNPVQKLTGNTDPKEGNANYVPNPVGRFYQEAVHKGRQVYECLDLVSIVA